MRLQPLYVRLGRLRKRARDVYKRQVLFVLDDADEAGYFYHDLTQMMGQEKVFFLSLIHILQPYHGLQMVIEAGL